MNSLSFTFSKDYISLRLRLLFKKEVVMADMANGKSSGIGHIFADNSPDCPKCGAPPSEHEVQNYDEIWRDGDVVCTRCDTRVRGYDAG